MYRSFSSLSRAVVLAAGLAPLGVFLLPPAVSAQEQSAEARTVEALKSHLRIAEHFALMGEEGALYGAEISASMFPERGGAAWESAISALYDPEIMRLRFESVFDSALEANPSALEEANRFFASPLGAKIAEYEVKARATLLDPDALEAAEVAAEKMATARAPRLRQIRDLMAAGDMIEMNTAGAMTAYLAFNMGLEAGLPLKDRMPEEDLMAQIWGQEGQMRVDTTDWLVAYLTLAYAPLSDEELSLYIDFMKSDAARAMNAALSAGYDAVYRPLMADLGRAAAAQMAGRDI